MCFVRGPRTYNPPVFIAERSAVEVEPGGTEDSADAEDIELAPGGMHRGDRARRAALPVLGRRCGAGVDLAELVGDGVDKGDVHRALHSARRRRDWYMCVGVERLGETQEWGEEG